MTEPTSRLDDLVHQRHRLGILSIAAEVSSVDFNYLKDSLELTAGNLNRHLAALDEAKLIRVKKEFRDRKPRTWISITKKGKSALGLEIAALRELVERHSPASEVHHPNRATRPVHP